MSADERNQIFRDRLVAVVADLTGGEGRDRQLRRMIGTMSDKLARQAGARNWSDLKERADGVTYDSMLSMFQKQSADSAAQGDARTIRAFEVLGISLIARRQYQADLAPGINFLDRFIEECATNARRAGAQFIPASRTRRQR